MSFERDLPPIGDEGLLYLGFSFTLGRDGVWGYGGSHHEPRRDGEGDSPSEGGYAMQGLYFDLYVSDDGERLYGDFIAGASFTEVVSGSTESLGFGSEYIEACWGGESYSGAGNPCGADGVMRRVSGPDSPAPVPEPATAALILGGLAGVGAWSRKKSA